MVERFVRAIVWGARADRRRLDRGCRDLHAISAAGLVLAGSFAALALVPIDAFQQLGFVLAVGLLIDAFLVRSVLTPAVVALVGERSGWPGRLLASSPPARVAEPAPHHPGLVPAPAGADRWELAHPSAE